MRLATKIWFCFLLLAASYLTAIFIFGSFTEASERTIAEVEGIFLPGITRAQDGEAAFKRMIVRYQDAIVMGDQEDLKKAGNATADLQAAITAIARDPRQDGRFRAEAETILRMLAAFDPVAREVYSKLATAHPPPELVPRAAALKQQSDAIGSIIAGLRQGLSDHLHALLNRLIRDAKANRSANLQLAGIALAVCAAAIFLVTRLWSVRMERLMTANQHLAQGDYAYPLEMTGQDEIGRLANGFGQMRHTILQRDQALRDLNNGLEQQIQERLRELQAKNQALSEEIGNRIRAEHSLRSLDEAVSQLDEAILLFSLTDGQATHRLSYANPAFARIAETIVGPGHPVSLIGDLFAPGPLPDALSASWHDALQGRQPAILRTTLPGKTGGTHILEWHIAPILKQSGLPPSVACILRDITDSVHQEMQHQQGAKLESIGQLAAGIAHEINTPIQFIGDNLRFMADAARDMARLDATRDRLLAACRDMAPPALVRECDAIAQEVDLPFVTEELPKAIAQSLEGVERVATIVKAMKEFAHPDQGEKKPTDLNHIITTTLIVARNEYKYVADLVTDFATDLPPVPCLAGEMKQVVLNLLVNAAHAIGDVVKGTDRKGTITVTTRAADGWAELRIADTGTGIPASARHRIFEPFFTTKEVGRGTGQGLYITRTVVEKKHGGTISFDTEPGKGTTFIIQLPLTAGGGT